MASPLDAVITFLFGHPPAEFARGDLTWTPVFTWLGIAMVVAVVVAVSAWAVRGLQGVSRRERVVLGAVRIGVVVVLGVCLLRPALVLSRAVPERNIVAILLDDSRSMQLEDHPAGSRLDAVRATFADSTAVVRALGDRFALRFFRVGGTVGAIEAASELRATGSRSDLGGALAGVRDALAGAPLAGMVLVSDGADNASTDLERELRVLDALALPVHTVGVGEARFARDVAVDAIRLPASVLEGGEAVGDIVVRLRGVGGDRAVFTLAAGGRLVHLDTVRLPESQELATIPVRVPPLPVGVHRVTAEIALLEPGPIAQNDAGDAVLRVRPGPERILHVEGEPRPDLAFLRRAVASDSAVQVVTLLRSAEGKYLRLGVSDSLELVGGFPTTRAELFAYRAIVLGSIETTFFTAEQLRMLEEFVSVRGGGLLMLGGRRALAEGGVGGTSLGGVLPIDFAPAPSRTDAGPAQMVQAVPTTEGVQHPALALDVTAEGTRAAWGGLPTVSVVNATGRLRPGATVLLEGRVAGGGGTIPLLVTHRYGRGRASVLMLQDLWRWQLNATVSDDDATLAALWPRLLRWSLDGVPDRMSLDVSPALLAPGDAAVADVRLHDEGFLATDRDEATLLLVPPDAPERELRLEPVLGAVGRYRATIVTAGAGRYGLELRNLQDDDSLRAVEAVVLAVEGRGDVGPAERDASLLAHIAERTGGTAFDIDALDGLPDAVSLTRAGVTVQESHDLWDAPVVLLTLLGLLATDWALRRRWGLA